VFFGDDDEDESSEACVFYRRGGGGGSFSVLVSQGKLNEDMENFLLSDAWIC